MDPQEIRKGGIPGSGYLDRKAGQLAKQLNATVTNSLVTVIALPGLLAHQQIGVEIPSHLSCPTDPIACRGREICLELGSEDLNFRAGQALSPFGPEERFWVPKRSAVGKEPCIGIDGRRLIVLIGDHGFDAFLQVLGHRRIAENRVRRQSR
jgi:hypothetical protein